MVIGFRPIQSDSCVYTHDSEQKKKELKERSEMTDMGEVSRILGMEVTRDYDEGTLAITQTA